MRLQVFTAATGFVLAGALLMASATGAQAADPTGYWRKANQGPHPAKMQLYRCGGSSICVKIVWLQNPRDSKGRELQDVRNVNPSLRGRKIEGMHIIRGMKKVSANQWKGTVYNPEDGKTYSASVTLASSRKIVLKGCVASFLCREQVWLKTSAPPPRVEEKKPEPQVEAKAKPEAAPKAAAAAAATATATTAAAPAPQVATTKNAAVAIPSGLQSPRPGYRYLNANAFGQSPAAYSGESMDSLFSLATPVATAPARPVTRSAATTPARAPAPQAAAPAQRAAPVQQAAPAPTQSASVEPEVAPEQESVEEQALASEEAQGAERLTWRERRQLRRKRRLKELQAQGQNLMPWMR